MWFKKSSWLFTRKPCISGLAFWMTTIYGLTSMQASKESGIRLGTIYSIKSRVLAQIKKCIVDLAHESSLEVNS